jgi:NAD(P)H-hydrate epimerase
VALAESGGVDRPALVLSGTGNNGGDALVAARWLHEAGVDVTVWIVEPREHSSRRSPSFEAQLATVRSMGINVLQAPSREDVAAWHARAPVIIDGVLGIGFSGVLNEGLAREILAAMNTIEGRLVVAVDTPSGLDVDVGSAQDVPLKADITVTFGGLKPAHVLSPARVSCGRIELVDIGFLAASEREAGERFPRRFAYADAERLLSYDPWGSLSSEAHKFTRGHVLVIGGSQGKIGAPILAGMAALRMGAGWVSIALRDEERQSSPIEVPPELTFESLFTPTSRHSAAESRVDAARLERFLDERRVRAVVVGPGCVLSPLDADSWRVLRAFVAERGGFVVVDAGATREALRALDSAGGPAPVADRFVMTPHPGEWERLGIHLPTPLNASAVESCVEALRGRGVSLLYKGATPVWISSEGAPMGFIVDEGTNVLARAGSGDVLAGAIAAHGAIGLPSAFASARAQVVVARAARLAARELGSDSVLASDIIQRLGRVGRESEEPSAHGCHGGGCCGSGGGCH